MRFFLKKFYKSLIFSNLSINITTRHLIILQLAVFRFSYLRGLPSGPKRMINAPG